MIKLPKPKHKYGYTADQIKEICKTYKIAQKKFWEFFGVNTCMLDKKLGSIYYPVDVERTLAFILGYRKVSLAEWD